MSVMITGVSVPQSAATGNVVGYLHCYNSGFTVPSNFAVTGPASGVFRIATTPSGPALVTAAGMLPQGFYSVKVKALGINTAYLETGRFVLQVAPPSPPSS